MSGGFLLICRRTTLQSEEIVAELVTSFLLPEVQKITMRENGTGICFCFPMFLFKSLVFRTKGNLIRHVSAKTAICSWPAVKRSQRKHLLAAHRIIHGDAETIMEQQPKPEPVKQDKLPDIKQSDEAGEPERPPSGQRVSSRPPSGQNPSSRPTSVKSSSSRPASGKSQKSDDGSAKQQSRTASPKSAQSSRAGSPKSRSSRTTSAKSRPDSSSSRPSPEPSNAGADEAS